MRGDYQPILPPCKDIYNKLNHKRDLGILQDWEERTTTVPDGRMVEGDGSTNAYRYIDSREYFRENDKNVINITKMDRNLPCMHRSTIVFEYELVV